MNSEHQQNERESESESELVAKVQESCSDKNVDLKDSTEQQAEEVEVQGAEQVDSSTTGRWLLQQQHQCSK